MSKKSPIVISTKFKDLSYESIQVNGKMHQLFNTSSIKYAQTLKVSANRRYMCDLTPLKKGVYSGEISEIEKIKNKIVLAINVELDEKEYVFANVFRDDEEVIKKLIEQANTVYGIEKLDDLIGKKIEFNTVIARKTGNEHECKIIAITLVKENTESEEQENDI